MRASARTWPAGASTVARCRSRVRDMRLLLVAGAFALGSSGCERVEAATVSRDASAVGEPECRHDSDCTIVPSTCCPCSMLGDRRVIAVTEAPRFTRALAARCAMGSYGCSCAENGTGACAPTAHPTCRPDGTCD